MREIPPAPKQANVLQMAMQSRIKLFYRPSAIVPEKPGMVWQDQLVFKNKVINLLLIIQPLITSRLSHFLIN